MNNLVLYMFESCPYCQKVMRFIKEKNIELVIKDIRIDENAKMELVEIGGKSQVPCLVINNKAMYESSDIIEWLSKN